MAVDAEIIGLAQQRHRDQTHAIIDAAGSDPALAHRVLMVLAEALSGEATAITNAKRKGHVGIARDWTDAAVRVRGVASRLESYVRLATPATTPELIGAPGAPSLDAMRAELAGGAPADPGRCSDCDHDRHRCKGCGSSVEHGQSTCPDAPCAEHAPDVDTDAADILRAAGLLDTPNALTGLVGPTMYPNGGPDPFDRPELGHASVAPFDPFTSPPPIGAELAPGESPFTSPAPAVERLTWVEFIGRSATLAPAPESSHSQASALAECGMRYQLGRLARHGHAAPERPGWALIGGKAVHAVINEIELIAYAGLPTVDIDPGPIWDRAFQAEINAARESSASEPATWYVSGRGKENYDFWRVEGRAMVARWIALQTDARRARTRIAKIADVPAVELEYRMKIGHPIGGTPAHVISHGFIDSVWIDLETHGLAIVDFKSGAKAPDDTVQLGEYAWALVDAFGVDPTRNPISAAYWLSRTGEFTAPFNPLERHPREEISYRHVSATRQKQAGIFLPNQSNFCTSCGFAAQCPTRGRA